MEEPSGKNDEKEDIEYHLAFQGSEKTPFGKLRMNKTQLLEFTLKQTRELISQEYPGFWEETNAVGFVDHSKGGVIFALSEENSILLESACFNSRLFQDRKKRLKSFASFKKSYISIYQHSFQSSNKGPRDFGWDIDPDFLPSFDRVLVIGPQGCMDFPDGFDLSAAQKFRKLASEGNVEAIQIMSLPSAIASQFLHDPLEGSSLHSACLRGDSKLVVYLISLLVSSSHNPYGGGGVDAEEGLLRAKDAMGRTPLHICAEKTRLEILQMILDVSSVSILEKDNLGRTPLEIALTVNPPKPEPESNYLDSMHERAKKVVFLLIENGGMGPLDERGQSHVAEKILESYYSLEDPSDLSEIADSSLLRPALFSVSPLGVTPLHSACTSGKRDCVEILLHVGVSYLVRDSSGCTPLHLAARAGHLDIVQLLINHHTTNQLPQEASGCLCSSCSSTSTLSLLLDCRDISGRTPLHLSLSHRKESSSLEILAAIDSLLQEVRFHSYMNRCCGCCCSNTKCGGGCECGGTCLSCNLPCKCLWMADSGGQSPLVVSLASKMSHCSSKILEIMEKLIDHKAPPPSMEVQSNSALFSLLFPSISPFLDSPFKSKCAIKKVDIPPSSALHTAIVTEQWDLFIDLLNAGFSLTFFSHHHNCTALEFAAMKEIPEESLRTGIITEQSKVGGSHSIFQEKLDGESSPTFLHLCATNSHIRPKYIELAVELGADPSALDKGSLTPLMVAIHHKNPNAVDTLLSFPSVIERELNPFHIQTDPGLTGFQIDHPLVYAVLHSPIEIFQSILIATLNAIDSLTLGKQTTQPINWPLPGDESWQYSKNSEDWRWFHYPLFVAAWSQHPNPQKLKLLLESGRFPTHNIWVPTPQECELTQGLFPPPSIQTSEKVQSLVNSLHFALFTRKSRHLYQSHHLYLLNDVCDALITSQCDVTLPFPFRVKGDQEGLSPVALLSLLKIPAELPNNALFSGLSTLSGDSAVSEIMKVLEHNPECLHQAAKVGREDVITIFIESFSRLPDEGTVIAAPIAAKMVESAANSEQWSYAVRLLWNFPGCLKSSPILPSGFSRSSLFRAAIDPHWPLFHALCIQSDIPSISYLLSLKIDVNELANVTATHRSKSLEEENIELGVTPICLAAHRGNEDLVNLLLKFGANPNFGDVTPLSVASWFGHTSIVTSLLEAGASPDATCKNAAFLFSLDGNQSALRVHQVVFSSPECYYSPMSAGCLNTCSYFYNLVSFSSHFISQSSKWRKCHSCPGLLSTFSTQTPLIRACANHNYEVVEILLNSGASPSIGSELRFSKDSLKRSYYNPTTQLLPIHLALNGPFPSPALTKRLTQNSLSSRLDPLGTTPLQIALRYLLRLDCLKEGVFLEAALTLLDLKCDHTHDADFDIQDLIGHPCDLIRFLSPNPVDGQTPFHLLTTLYSRFLEKTDSSSLSLVLYKQLLELLSQLERSSVVPYLLDAERKKDQQTALQIAAALGLNSVLLSLIQASASDDKTFRGESPISAACGGKGNAETIQILTSAGLTRGIDEEGPSGFSPLSSAARRGNPSMIRELLKAGAYLESDPSGSNTPTTKHPSYQAALAGRSDAFLVLTNHHPPPVECIFAAAVSGCKEIATLLVEKHFDSSILALKDGNGLYPLNHAVGFGHWECADYMMSISPDEVVLDSTELSHIRSNLHAHFNQGKAGTDVGKNLFSLSPLEDQVHFIEELASQHKQFCTFLGKIDFPKLSASHLPFVFRIASKSKAQTVLILIPFLEKASLPLSSCINIDGNSLLHSAVMKGWRLEEFAQLVNLCKEQEGQPISSISLLSHANDSGELPIHLAIALGRIQIAKFLIHLLPESLSMKDKCGMTPIDCATPFTKTKLESSSPYPPAQPRDPPSQYVLHFWGPFEEYSEASERLNLHDIRTIAVSEAGTDYNLPSFEDQIIHIQEEINSLLNNPDPEVIVQVDDSLLSALMANNYRAVDLGSKLLLGRVMDVIQDLCQDTVGRDEVRKHFTHINLTLAFSNEDVGCSFSDGTLIDRVFIGDTVIENCNIATVLKPEFGLENFRFIDVLTTVPIELANHILSFLDSSSLRTVGKVSLQWGSLLRQLKKPM